MKNMKNIYLKFALLLGFIFSFTASCERENSDDAELATFPINPEVFIDGFSSGLEYLPFNGSKLDAFTVDQETKYEGSASMRFDIPNVGDPEGAFAGAIFPDNTGRDLSGFNVLTFWAKATQAGTINEIGFGNDFGENKYVVTVQNLQLSTNWKKYIIPIPDPSKLTQEKGMFWYAEGPEDDKGYSFWIDELQYENLGTIAHPEPAIFNGEDITQQTFVGIDNIVSGLSETFNLATGGDISVTVAPAYFEFSSSDPTVATVDELGVISIIGAGSSVISATLGGINATGSLTIESLGEFTAAQTPPARDPADVISIFSDAYTNQPVDYYNGFWQFSTTLGEDDIEIEGDNIIKYTELNFVGIQFAVDVPTIDASQMTHFHIDVQVEDQVESGDIIEIGLADLGADNAFDGGDDSRHNLELDSSTLVSGEWVSVDIPFTDLTGLTNRANLGQIILVSAGTGTITNILVDNIYFYKDQGGSAMVPTEAAPTPTQAEADVISVYSDAYTDVSGTDFNPDWGQATVVTEESIVGDNVQLYTGLNYQGIVLGSSQDVSAMEFLHIDYWSASSTALNTFLISSGPVEMAKALVVPTEGGWTSVDIPLGDFSAVDLADVIQMKFDGNSDIYLDNIYFYKEAGAATEPSSAAPTPTQAEADVISVYSDAYTDVSGTDFNPDWGQATVVTEESIAGDNVQLYTGLNYQGIALGSAQDVSGMEFLHLDYWTANSTALNTFLISSGPVETVKALTVPTGGGWTSMDIPIGDFSPVDLADVIQMKFDGDGDVYLDNIYFYKEAGAATEPSSAAPTPTQAEADVISVYSDAYTDVSGTDFNPNWGQSTVVTEESIAGDNVQLYTGLNYQGIALGSAQDVSGMEFLHIDYWSVSSTALNTFLISSGPVEMAKALAVPTGGGWTSVDIPLGDFSAVDLADVIQMKFDGDGDVYLDNIYFYKSSGGSAYDLSMPIDFETTGHGAAWTWNVFENGSNEPLEFVANPDASGINTSSTVAKITALQTGQPWVGTETAHGAMGITFTLDATNTTVKIMVYKSVISDVGIKFATPAGGAQSEIKVANTVVNQWEELTFDFSGYIGLGDTSGLDQIIVFPDFDLGGRTSDNVVYFDNIRFE